MSEKPKIFALIPARGGSKGIKNKNLKKINGLTLIERCVYSLKNSKLIDKIYVSSDSQRILNHTKKIGAFPIKRRPELAQDSSSSESVIFDFLNENTEIRKTDYLLLAQATSPFIYKEDIEKIINNVLRNRLDSSFLAKKFHGFIWHINKKKSFGINHTHLKERIRRQDKMPEFHEQGSLYLMKVSKFLQTQNRFCGKCNLTESHNITFEIDEKEDLLLAEKIAKEVDVKLFRSRSKNNRILAIGIDFDGVLTNNKVYVDTNGNESVLCSRDDGHAVSELKKRGIKLIIISKERNAVVSHRAKKLGIEVIQACDDKLKYFKEWLEKNKIRKDDAAFIGNDVPDIPCLDYAKYGFVPNDSKVIKTGYIKLNSLGGDGCLREILNLYI